MDKDKDQKQCEQAMRDYPGMAIDSADDEKVTEQRVDARTKAQNNNPRNTDNAMPVNPCKE